ncbi:MAG: hypothetical protein HQL35_12380 [Alphaproteobacteria bacterium]|nr:hypothetical protein [Alphaproteobacteria bacterium]
MTDAASPIATMVLNAKRYGLSQRQLAAFDDALNTAAATIEGETKTEDAEAPSATDLVRQYVTARIRDRISGYGDLEDLKSMSPEDLLFDMVGNRSRRRDRENSNVSSLLNMHFDLNTLLLLGGK